MALIAEVAHALLAVRSPAALFVGGALRGWLESGGDLARDYFQVTQPKSHWTASAIYRAMYQEMFSNFEKTSPHPDERPDSDCSASLGLSNQPEGEPYERSPSSSRPYRRTLR
ncbi:MAG: hypothetical protein KF834_04760 [Burkholderiales bacterium]|nr:hypothetical protein [Burkholderiales bacterium]